MDLLERTAVIGEIARRKRTGQLGKTAMMKLLHLLQDGLKVPLGYRFTLYNYGPYATEVMSDIDFAQSLGQVSVAYGGPDQGYRIEAVPCAGNTPKLDEMKAKLDSLMDLFGGMSARELELRFTLLFLSRAFERDRLINRLRELKPKYSDQETREALEELQRKSVV